MMCRTSVVGSVCRVVLQHGGVLSHEKKRTGASQPHVAGLCAPSLTQLGRGQAARRLEGVALIGRFTLLLRAFRAHG